jgi:hypothetical protein
LGIANRPWGTFCTTQFWKIRPTDFFDLRSSSRTGRQIFVSVYCKKHNNRCRILRWSRILPLNCKNIKFCLSKLSFTGRMGYRQRFGFGCQSILKQSLK